MPIRMQEQQYGLAFRPQTDIATANTDAQFWRLRKVNAQLPIPALQTENDAAEYGKGNPYASQVFPIAWRSHGSLEKYLSAEIAAWAMAFGLGKAVETGTAPNFVYTCTPLNPSNGTDPAELPYFTVAAQIRPGASAAADYAVIGCAVNSWQITLGSGPGRDNSKIAIEYAGSGRFTEPSGISLPTDTLAEKLLLSASLSFAAHGTDYITARRLVSLEVGWQNNLMADMGYYPGSGIQNGAAVAGRLMFGVQSASVRFTALLEQSSPEFARLRQQTEGTAVITLTHDVNNSLQLTFHRVVVSALEFGETDGFATIQCELTPLWDSTNGLLTAVAKCNIDNIGA